MRVIRTGLTPLKGARHQARPHVDLTASGPCGDRVFCLVDPVRERVLRTVEHPALLRLVALWSSGVLTVRLPDGDTVSGAPAATGEPRTVDYWGRPARVELLSGPWSAACSALLGYDVVLAQASHPGEVVYGGSVSLVTTSSLDRLAEGAAGTVDSAQFRATFTLGTAGLPPHVEDGWVGRVLRLGEAEVEVRGVIPRCAVVDLDPASGVDTTGVLRELGRYRRGAGEVTFGVDAVVARAGRVVVGDPVEVLMERERAETMADAVGGI